MQADKASSFLCLILKRGEYSPCFALLEAQSGLADRVVQLLQCRDVGAAVGCGEGEGAPRAGGRAHLVAGDVHQGAGHTDGDGVVVAQGPLLGMTQRSQYITFRF